MRYAIIALIVAVLAGCAGSPQLPYQYGTLKLIESDSVTAEAVIDRTESVRGLLDREASFDKLEDRVKEAVGYSDLPASDRLLVNTLIDDVEYDLQLPDDLILTSEHKAVIRDRLRWIEQAARMAE